MYDFEVDVDVVKVNLMTEFIIDGMSSKLM